MMRAPYASCTALPAYIESKMDAGAGAMPGARQDLTGMVSGPPEARRDGDACNWCDAGMGLPLSGTDRRGGAVQRVWIAVSRDYPRPGSLSQSLKRMDAK